MAKAWKASRNTGLAAYADTFDGNLWGNAILTSWWKKKTRAITGWVTASSSNARPMLRRQRCGAGGIREHGGRTTPTLRETLSAVRSRIFIIWLISAASGSHWRGASVTYEGIVGGEIAEFWPDIAQRLMKKRQAKQDKAAQPAGAATQTAPDAPSANLSNSRQSRFEMSGRSARYGYRASGCSDESTRRVRSHWTGRGRCCFELWGSGSGGAPHPFPELQIACWGSRRRLLAALPGSAATCLLPRL